MCILSYIYGSHSLELGEDIELFYVVQDFCLVTVWPKTFYMQLKCMSLPFLPYLSQILTKLLEILISLQGIQISIYVCNVRELIFFLFGTINFTTKD